MAIQSRASRTRRSVIRSVSAGLLAALVLAACVPTASAPSQTAKPTSAPVDPTGSASVTPPAETPRPKGEILIWDPPGDLFQVAEAAIPAFNTKYPDIVVRHEAVDQAKIGPTLTTGVGVPDGALVPDETLGTIADQLYDLTDLIQPHVDDIVDYKLRVNTHDGQIKGIPYDVDPAMLFYREDILAKHGLSIDGVETYDDLIELAKELKAKDPSLKPIRIENAPGLIVLWTAMFANQQGTSYVDADGNLALESPEFLRILEFYKRVIDEGLASRQDIFSPGDIAANDKDIQVFVPYAIWYNYGITSLFKEATGKFRATQLPAWEVGGSRAASMGGSSFIIPAKAANPDLAWLYYEFMMTSEEGYKAYFGASDIYPGGITTLLPAYEPAYGSKLMENPASLGGQDLWSLATDIAQNIPGDYYFPTWYGQMGDIFGANVQRMYDGKLTPEEVLKKSAEEITAKLIR